MSGVKSQMLVFDMDGVLVDVTESYRETIVRTVEHFTGKTISRDSIQDYKNQGGWNNDWVLSQKICRDLGVEIALRDDRRVFQLPVSRSGHDPSRALAAARRVARSPGRTIRIRHLHRAHHRGSRDHAESRGRARSLPAGFRQRCGVRKARARRIAEDRRACIRRRSCSTSATRWTMRAAPGPRTCRSSASPRADSPRREELVDLLRLEGAIQVIEDINEIG